jgi:hypothetical protein
MPTIKLDRMVVGGTGTARTAERASRP